MGQKRATTESQRTARRSRILDAATHLLDSWSPDDVSVDRIAEKAGIAKGTVYLYFRTREELLLEVFGIHYCRWLEDLAKELRESPGDLNPSEVGRLTAVTLLRSNPLLQLFGSADMLFGGNVSVETQYEVRLRQRQWIEKVASVLEERLDAVTLTGARRWLIRAGAFIAGYAPRSCPSRPSARVLERPELDLFAVDLESELQYIATTMLLPS